MNEEGRASSLITAVRTDPTDWYFFFAFLCALAWTPLWLGSNRPFAWGVNAVLFGGLVLVFELILLLRGRSHPIGVKSIIWPVLFFVPVVLWIVFQISTQVPATIQHPIWDMASQALDTPLQGSVSVNRDLTQLALLRLLTAASVFWLALQLSRDSYRARLLVQAIGIIGTVYSVYGLLMLPLGGPIFWFDIPTSSRLVRSTFVNRNSFATFAGIALLANLAILLRLYRHQGAGTPSRRAIALFIQANGRYGVWVLACCLITMVALLLTGSRAGILSSVFGLVALVMLTFGFRRKKARDRIETLIFLSVAVAAGFFFFGDVFAGRIATSGLGDTNRMAVYRITIQSILDAPVLGFGYGTFPDVFSIYRDQSIALWGVWDRAHNTYLDVFQGLGLVFGTLLIASVAFLGYRCMVGISKRRMSVLPCCVALAALLLVGVHALVDFSLEIQAVTLTLMALLGSGVAQSESSRHSTAD